jgi:hypothetical protein
MDVLIRSLSPGDGFPNQLPTSCAAPPILNDTASRAILQTPRRALRGVNRQQRLNVQISEKIRSLVGHRTDSRSGGGICSLISIPSHVNAPSEETAVFCSLFCFLQSLAQPNYLSFLFRRFSL